MGNCVYYVRPEALIVPNDARNGELSPTRTASTTRGSSRSSGCRPRPRTSRRPGIVGVEIEEKQHTWGTGARFAGGNAAKLYGETIEFFVFGTAVVPQRRRSPRPSPRWSSRRTTEASDEPARTSNRPQLALSDLSVTEFLTLSRVGFLPHGLVVGSAICDAGWTNLSGQTREVTSLSQAMRGRAEPRGRRACATRPRKLQGRGRRRRAPPRRAPQVAWRASGRQDHRARHRGRVRRRARAAGLARRAHPPPGRRPALHLRALGAGLRHAAARRIPSRRASRWAAASTS